MLTQIGIKAKKAERVLMTAPLVVRDRALKAIADALRENCAYIIDENKKDTERARADGMSSSMLDRLSLDDTVGDIIFNSEVQNIIKNQAGVTLDHPALQYVGKIPLKPVSRLASKLGGKEVVGLANQFLQTIKKDKK